MAGELNPKIVSLSLAGVSGIVYLVCAAFFAIAPKATLGFFKDMFHGIDITQIGRTAVPFGSTVAGFVEILVASLVVGWLFAVVYNSLQLKIERRPVPA